VGGLWSYATKVRDKSRLWEEVIVSAQTWSERSRDDADEAYGEQSIYLCKSGLASDA